MRKRPNTNYRKIWIDAYGEPPKDEYGISYDIHHKDGNPHNNSLENLEAVSVLQHYLIHKERGDKAACILIAKRIGFKHDSSGTNNHFFGKKHLPENLKKAVEVRRRNGNGDYFHGKGCPLTQSYVKENNRRRLTSYNPMQDEIARKKSAQKSKETRSTFSFWHKTFFQRLINYQEIQNYIEQNSYVDKRTLCSQFGVKTDMAKTIITKFKAELLSSHGGEDNGNAR